MTAFVGVADDLYATPLAVAGAELRFRCRYADDAALSSSPPRNVVLCAMKPRAPVSYNARAVGLRVFDLRLSEMMADERAS